jgi:L-threonylcarbamoyladenylate synthase
MGLIDLSTAIQQLLQGDVVGMPTETVYGLAACIDKKSAVEKIFTTKQRPFFDPLIVHVSSTEMAQKLCLQWPKIAEVLAQKFWPGPLTLVLPKNHHVSDLITAGLPSVGLRWPQHPLAEALIQGTQTPLAAPSANRFGKTSPTTAQAVLQELPSVGVVDGGPCDVGIESTVLMIKLMDSTCQLAILRPGKITQEDISQCLSFHPQLDFQWVTSVSKKESPGHMKHHYMPAIPLITCLKNSSSQDELLEWANSQIHSIPDMVEGIHIVKPRSALRRPGVLTLDQDPSLACRQFYSQLRQLSESDHDCILCFFEHSSKDSRWDGLRDRLMKASSLIFQ